MFGAPEKSGRKEVRAVRICLHVRNLTINKTLIKIIELRKVLSCSSIALMTRFPIFRLLMYNLGSLHFHR